MKMSIVILSLATAMTVTSVVWAVREVIAK